jgi:hypothetical protein
MAKFVETDASHANPNQYVGCRSIRRASTRPSPPALADQPTSGNRWPKGDGAHAGTSCGSPAPPTSSR